MAEFRISGIWKRNGVINNYAVHSVVSDGTTRAQKTSKADAIKLLETPGNSAITWLWNYSQSAWVAGEKVEVVKGATEKYLRSNPDNKRTDNLDHLIDFDWIQP